MRAIGAAARAPKPPFSTITASAIVGLVSRRVGDEQRMVAVALGDLRLSTYFSFCFMPITCAVPVLPPLRVRRAGEGARAGAFLVDADHRALHELDVLAA